MLLAVALAGAAIAAGSPRAGAGSAHGFSHGDSGDEFWYALVSPDGKNLSGSTDSDSWDDIGREVRELGHEALWFRFDRSDYLVQDPATLDRAREILRPMEELGRQQGRLGRIQSELGRRQSGLGAQQARLGATQAKLSIRIASLTRREDSDRGEQRALERQLEDVTGQQEALSRQQEPLAREQERLGARQEALGRQQERLSARASEEMRRLAEDAIEQGLAKPVR
jgi:hypothetical protein